MLVKVKYYSFKPLRLVGPVRAANVGQVPHSIMPVTPEDRERNLKLKRKRKRNCWLRLGLRSVQLTALQCTISTPCLHRS
jgi:hypothetical protein